MKEPADNLKIDSNAGERPDFDSLRPPEDLVRGERTRDDFFDAVLQLDEPATVRGVADLAGHGTDAAREYLDWFERIGIVVQTGTEPATYRLNREYLAWRRSQEIRAQFDTKEIVTRLAEQRERAQELAAEFDGDSPEKVSLADYADEADVPIEAAWERLSEWQTVRRRVELLDRAVSAADGSTADRSQSSV
ncbi:DUF7342 family protein [Salinibaculum salinum]|uniref:DUF7342 family protein n=1 Tax=Salinibaculum salinum TaxID=3131996 RepID=UPI0030EC8B72